MFNNYLSPIILLIKILLIIFLISIIPISFAKTNDFILPKGNLAIIAPPVINKDYYLIEFGFVTEKKINRWNYSYNAYVNAALFEDWLNKPSKLSAGGLGFKGGVFLPTQPWIPLLFTMSFGYAKTVLNKNPLIGREGSNIAKKDMLLLEAGLLYRYNKTFLRFAYQINNVKYFSRHSILMIGVNY